MIVLSTHQHYLRGRQARKQAQAKLPPEMRNRAGSYVAVPRAGGNAVEFSPTERISVEGKRYLTIHLVDPLRYEVMTAWEYLTGLNKGV